MGLKNEATSLRSDISYIAERVTMVKGGVMRTDVTGHDDEFGDMFDPAKTDKGEVLANLTLAFRHLEDARMRLGKAIQASEGGVSPLP